MKKKKKLIATDLSKQQAFDTDPKAIQQINCTGNLHRAEAAWMVFILEEVIETISQRTARVLPMFIINLNFNIISIRK